MECVFPSGFRWESKDGDGHPKRCCLIAPSGDVAGTVYMKPDHDKYIWFVWDEHGTGGENSAETSANQAMLNVESATLRWGRHFK